MSYRLGFAVKVLGNGGMKSNDGRRWQSGPHLSSSLELLDAVFDYLDDVDIRVYRLSSSTVPYGTHPDLPQLDYRRQIGECEKPLARLGEKASRLGLRLSTHPGQYSVLSSPDPEIAHKARLDVEQDALLLDALGTGPEAVVVIHVGGMYGDARASLDRWVRSFEALSESARTRLVVEHDERCFDLSDAIELHERTVSASCSTSTTTAATRLAAGRTSVRRSPLRWTRGQPAFGRRCTCRAHGPSSGRSVAARGLHFSTSTRISSVRGIS